jgi:hypothetical protein
VSEHDPFSFGVVSLLLATISFPACWLATCRTLKVDPVVAVRLD